MAANRTAESPKMRVVARNRCTPRRLERAQGSARVSFQAAAQRTTVRDLYQSGCLKVRLPRNTDHQAAEAVLINTSGGLTDGDLLDVSCSWGEGASACVTTQACERIYKSRGEYAHISTKLHVASGANAFWLPQETILFHGGRLDRSTDVRMEHGARLLASEAVILGRPAMGEEVRAGRLRDRWTVRLNGKRVFIDSLELDGEIAARLDRPATGAGARAFATIILCGDDLEAAQSALVPCLEASAISGGCSNLGEVLLARLLAPNGYQLRKALVEVLLVLGKGQAMPRVWCC